MLSKRAPEVKRIVFETGPLSVWFYHSLSAAGLPAICIDARHAKAALDIATNKTDANDADGLAHLAEVGFFREVRVKGYESMLSRTLVAARLRLVRISTELSNQIRGLMKTFGLVVPAGKGGAFDRNVCALVSELKALEPIILSLLTAWRATRREAAELGRRLLKAARDDNSCQLLMSIPGIGAITATSFVTRRRGPCQLHIIAFCGRVAGPHDPPLSVRPGRLRRSHLQTRRRSSPWAPLRSRDGDPHSKRG